MKTILLGVILVLIMLVIFLLHRFTRKKHPHRLVKLMMFHLYVYIGLLLFVGYHFFSALPYRAWADEVKASFSTETRSATDVTSSLFPRKDGSQTFINRENNVSMVTTIHIIRLYICPFLCFTYCTCRTKLPLTPNRYLLYLRTSLTLKCQKTI